MKIGIDMGHTLSGLGTGAQSIVKETDINRVVGKLIIKYLQQLGDTVVNCTVDKSNSDLADRVTIANRSGLDVFVSLHLNAGGGKGVETYIYNGNYAGKENNRVLAKRTNDAIAGLGFYNRGVKEANHYVTRNTIAPAYLIELFFVDTKSDVDLYNKLGADKIARTIAEAISNKKLPASTTTTSSYKVGDKVIVSKSATHYATGQPMANFVKGSTYSIVELKSDRALLSGINSWVYLNNLSKVGNTSQSFKEYKVKIATDVLNVRAGAGTKYAVTATVKCNEVYTIVAESNGWGKLKSGVGWISLSYTQKY